MALVVLVASSTSDVAEVPIGQLDSSGGCALHGRFHTRLLPHRDSAELASLVLSFCWIEARATEGI
jgi:hypothetical protein